ncbi:MAG: PH domain-containing protein [Pedococcus sp.]
MSEPAGRTDQPWLHLHPLSPILRGGLAFAALVAYFVSQQLDTLFGASGDDPTRGHLGWAVLVVAGVLLVIVAGSWLSWRFSRYRVGVTLIELRTGFLFRQHRQVRFDRIQAVDVGRPLLARLTGLSEVVVQSAGGRNSQLKLSFLAASRAQEVREQLMSLASVADSGTRTDDPPASTWGGALDVADPGRPADGDPAATGMVGHRVVLVPNVRVVQSILYRGQSVFLVLAVPALVGSFIAGVGANVAWLGPMTLALGTAQFKRLMHEWNFELLHRGDRLRLRHGLTDLRATTVPMHRIQAVEASQPLPWRLTGWWRLRMNVAGAGQGEDATETVLLPVGTFEEVLGVLVLVLPGTPPEVIAAALLGDGPGYGFTTATARARRLDPLGWRRLGYAAAPQVLVTRRGRWWRAAQFVPHARVQSLKVSQGPLERSQGVASVHLVSTPGPVSPVVAHLDLAQAERLLEEQVVRSGLARRHT